MDNHTDALICGAGASGLTLAIELARRGISFRLIERRTEPFGGSRGKGIQPRTQEVFEDLGVLDRIVACGGPYPVQRIHASDGTCRDVEMQDQGAATPAEPHALALMVPQFRTEEVLRERLAELGSQPHFGCQLVHLEQNDHEVIAHLLDEGGASTLRARYLVGADGGHSFVRQALQIDFPGKSLGVRALVADVELSGLTHDAWHRFNDDDMQRHLSICALRGTTLFQIQAPIALEGEVDLSAAGLSKLTLERTGRHDIQIHSVSWASAYHMSARLADRYRLGRVFLIGDAAHVHPPTGGQGLNTSVQDAYNLGWKLAAVVNGAPAALLESYEEERRPIAAEMLGLSTSLLQAQGRGEIRRGRNVRQLDLTYRHGSLALEHPARTAGLRAGDRAPDAPIRGAAGQSLRLFELFKGAHFTLLGYEVDVAAVRPRAHLRIHSFGTRQELIDTAGHFAAAYALAPGDWALVRPDGYIGALVHSSAVSALETYLQHVGLSA